MDRDCYAVSAGAIKRGWIVRIDIGKCIKVLICRDVKLGNKWRIRIFKYLFELGIAPISIKIRQNLKFMHLCKCEQYQAH